MTKNYVGCYTIHMQTVLVEQPPVRSTVTGQYEIYAEWGGSHEAPSNQKCITRVKIVSSSRNNKVYHKFIPKHVCRILRAVLNLRQLDKFRKYINNIFQSSV